MNVAAGVAECVSFILGLLGILVGLVALVLAILTVIDVAPRPESAFRRAGTSKTLWIVLPIVGMFVCGIGALIVGNVWFSNYRPKVIEAEGRRSLADEYVGAAGVASGIRLASGLDRPRRSMAMTTSGRSASRCPTRCSTTCATAWRAPAGPTRSRTRRGTTAPTSSICATSASTGRRSSTGGRRKSGSTAGRTSSPTSTAQQVHFIHARSPEPDAFPLLITHGWPGSVSEFLDVIEPLRDPRVTAATRRRVPRRVPVDPRLRVVGSDDEPGWDVQRVAEAWKVLMARLGYDRYGAQGGDWGAIDLGQLAALDAEHVVGLHSNMLLAFPANAAEIALTEQEAADLAAAGEFMQRGSAYQEIQGKNPQTLGYGLTDSPAGLAGWIVEKFWAWTDHDGDLEQAVTRDQILTNLTVYWVTKTINSSVRLYCESQPHRPVRPDGRVRRRVPTAAAVFPKEMFRIPRAYAEASFNLVRYTRFDRGGHFAALEEPDLLIDDIRAFFREVR